MKHAEGIFLSKQDLRIYYQSWVPDNPRATVVIVHGVCEHSGRYAHVAKHLVDIGCAVYALDHRGHGKSGGPRAYVDRFANLVADIDTCVDLARSQQRGRPLFLLGHSLGGALSLGYALEHAAKLKGLILSGPAVALDGAPPLAQAIARFLSVVAPKLGMLKIDPSLVSRDPAEVAAYANDPLNARGKLPARTFGEIVKFVQKLPAAMPRIKLPLLVMHGGDDKLAGVSGSRMVVGRAGSRDKTLKVYDGLYHEIFNELAEDRARVLNDLSSWIDAHLSGE